MCPSGFLAKKSRKNHKYAVLRLLDRYSLQKWMFYHLKWRENPLVFPNKKWSFLSFRELLFEFFVFKRFTTFWISVYAILRKKRSYHNREGENKNRLRDFKFCLHDSVYRLSTMIAATQGVIHFNFNFSFVFTASDGKQNKNILYNTLYI